MKGNGVPSLGGSVSETPSFASRMKDIRIVHSGKEKLFRKRKRYTDRTFWKGETISRNEKDIRVVHSGKEKLFRKRKRYTGRTFWKGETISRNEIDIRIVHSGKEKLFPETKKIYGSYILERRTILKTHAKPMGGAQGCQRGPFPSVEPL